MKLRLVLVTLLLVLATSPVTAKQQKDPLLTVKELPQASLLLEENGRELLSKHADKPMVPASGARARRASRGRASRATAVAMLAGTRRAAPE